MDRVHIQEQNEDDEWVTRVSGFGFKGRMFLSFGIHTPETGTRNWGIAVAAWNEGVEIEFDLEVARIIRLVLDNQAPTATGSIPSQRIDAGSSRSINVSRYFTDPDDDALTYSATSSAPSVVETSVSGSTVRLAGREAGTASVTVTARDPGGLSATQQFSVTVPSSSPPTGDACRVGLVLSPGDYCTVTIPNVSGTDRFRVTSDGRGCYGSFCSGGRLSLNGFVAANISGSSNWRIESMP